MTDEEQKALEEEAGRFMLMNDHEEHEIERLMAYDNKKLLNSNQEKEKNHYEI